MLLFGYLIKKVINSDLLRNKIPIKIIFFLPKVFFQKFLQDLLNAQD